MPDEGKDGWVVWAESIEKRQEDQDARMRKLEIFVAKASVIVGIIILLAPLIWRLIKHFWPEA